MNAIFLDTGYVLALELANDQNHRAAIEHWRQWEAEPSPLLTTSYVFGEIVTFFNHRGHHDKAIQVGNSLLRSSAMELVHVDEDLFVAGWEMLQQHRDKRYSLTDCVSFVAMARRGIDRVLTFDHHFRQAGFQVEP